MIERILIPVILLIVLSGWYLWLYRLRTVRRRAVALLCLVPSAVITIYTVYLAALPDFAPAKTTVLNVYLFLLGLVAVPQTLFALCSATGGLVRRLTHGRRNWGDVVGTLVVLLVWYVLVFGSFVGFNKVEVRHITYTSDNLPEAFDGYRIVHFSDVHLGTFDASRDDLPARAVDIINAQKADLIAFTGDLQNMRPSEIAPYEALLASLKARDGVVSVLGNHDYAHYVKASEAEKAANVREHIAAHRRLGWTLLMNGHRTIRRGADSIVVGGMENDGDGKRFSQAGDIGKTLAGVTDSAFVVMLEHDPSSWRRKILPQSRAQLTLSGHTHAMQFEVMDWSPASFVYDEWGGVFYEGGRAINVSTGLGGFIPFRFGVPGEIVVIELRRAGKQTD